MGLNQAQNEVFCHFIEFGSYVFLKLYTVIAPNNVQHLVKENPQQMGRTGQTRAQKTFFRHFS